MTPEADRLLEKSRRLLDRAERMVVAGLAEDAGRSAYLAGYLAAQAFLFEKNGKVAKTHSGLHAEFAAMDGFGIPDRRGTKTISASHL